MKRLLISLVVLSGSIYLGCRQEGPSEVPSRTAQNDPAAGTDIVRGESGTIIKRSGWQLPVELPNDKQYHATTVITEGRQVKVLNSPFIPKEKLVVRIPNVREGGVAEYQVSQIIEFTDERKKPYCYQLVAGSGDRPDLFSYRDDDGDGVFETLGEGCTVPAWVK